MGKSQSPPVNERKTLWSLATYHLFNDSLNNLLPALLPLIRLEFGMNYEDSGAIVACGLFVILLLQPIVGFLSDWINPKYLLNFGILGYALSSIFLVFINSYAGLFLMIMMARLFASVYHPVGFAYNVRFFDQGLKDKALGIQIAASGFAISVVLISSPIIGKFMGWRIPFLIWGSLGFLSVILLSKHLSDPRGDMHKKWNAGFLKGILKWLLIFLIPISFGGIIFTTIIVYMPFLLTDKLRLNEQTAGIILSTWILSGTVSNFYFGKIAKKFNKLKILLSAYIICGVFGIIIAVSSELLIIIFSLIVIGLFQFITYPSLFSIISDVVPLQNMGSAFGILFSLQILGGTMFSYIHGVTADMFGISMPFQILAVLCFFTAIYFYIICKKIIPLGLSQKQNK